MADFDSNWQNAMGGHLDYHKAAESAGEGGGEGPKKGGGGNERYQPPKGYKPSTAEDRTKWNKFLDYLEQKGVGGSKDLDARDKSLGKKYMAEYNKANPDATVSEDFIPVAQYESYLIRKKNQFPGLSEAQSKRAFANLPPQYRDKPISSVDNWLGSATSRQYYPEFERSDAKQKTKFGTSFEKYLQGLDLPADGAPQK